MTVRHLGSVMLRRWYVVVVALVVAGAGGFLLERGGGVYTSETVVSFTLPNKTTLSLDSGFNDSSVIAFAGIVARGVNNGVSPKRYSTDDAPYYGAGIREGVLVSVPNAGNQWVTSYLRAEIVLKIVGRSQGWVARKQSALLAKVTQISEAQQVAVTSSGARIQAVPIPLTRKISYIVPSLGSVIAAYIALFVAALIVGGSGALLLDRRLRARGERSRRSVPREMVIERSER